VESIYASRRAFSLPTNNMTGAIRLNVKGREPSGLVAPGAEYDALCDGLAEALLELVNADTGRPAVRWVRRADELYHGPRLGDLPDLFVEWDHDAPITTLTSPRIGTLTLPYRGDRTGDHRAGGLLLARGPGLRRGDEIKPGVRTEDVAPTVLDLLGVARPGGFEGASHLGVLKKD
jgi:predicted AlkP superfamily phosphohydrolase/phosphomutase